MKPVLAIALTASLLCAVPSPAARAQDAAVAPVAQQPQAPVAPPVLQPFVATYEVYNAGRRLGDATMQVVHAGNGRWRMDLGMKGAGLMRLTGINLQQSTVFESDGAALRPISQSTVRRVLFSNRHVTGIYDWVHGVATWTGDIKDTRRAPVKLQPGDLSGLLINLAVIRDAEPGKALAYRYVDSGRVRDHVYDVAPQTEQVTVGDIDYDAMRVKRLHGNDETTIWVAHGVPTPIRIIQRDGGKETYDLRLIQYTGA